MIFSLSASTIFFEVFQGKVKGDDAFGVWFLKTRKISKMPLEVLNFSSCGH